MKIISFRSMQHNWVVKGVCLGLMAGLLTGCASTTDEDLFRNLSAKEIYALGEENTKTQDYKRAIRDFEALQARYPFGEYAEKAQLALTYAYLRKGDHAQALASADRFIRMHPNHPKVDYAYYLRGLANYETNLSFSYRHLPLDRSLRDPEEAKQSFDDFKLLLERFPHSEYVPDAKQRMIFLKNQLADYELHVAQYYLKRSVHLAAANRAAHLVKFFDKTDAVPEALGIMVKAYRKMGMTQLAEDALATLKANYPESGAAVALR